MVRSRAMVAREPGQVREEAALSDTDHAPWGSLTGARGRRERSKADLDGGCTVNSLSLSRPASHAPRFSASAPGRPRRTGRRAASTGPAGHRGGWRLDRRARYDANL